MNPLAARAGVDGARLGFGLGVEVEVVTPSLADAGWTAEDERLFHIVGELGTNSPEGQALIADLKGQYGDGWVAKWGDLQDSLQAKYMKAESDAERLAELQTTTVAEAAKADPTGVFVSEGSVGYSVHDINAYQSMSPQEQAAFLLGFEDVQAASYFTMVAGLPDATARLLPPPLGNKGAYMGTDGTRYDSLEDLLAAGGSLPGATSVTTSTGEVITDPDRLKNLTFEETFGAPTPVTGGLDPSSAFTPVADADGPLGPLGPTWEKAAEFGTAPTTTSKTAAPIVSSTALDTVDVTKTGSTVNVKGQPKNLTFGPNSFAPTPSVSPVEDPGDIMPVATAGFGGSLGLLAILGLGLAVLAAPKRKR